MWKFLASFSSDDFMPHGHCFMWQPGIMALHIVSDAVITFSYYSIPFALAYFVMRRRDVSFGWLGILFGTFILACGTTHLLGIVVIWQPIYWMDGWVKAVTAVTSIGTAIVVWRLMPQLLAVPSTSQLTAEVAQRREAEQEVRTLNGQLEVRVQERTLQLEKTNGELTAAIHAKEVLLQELHHRVKNNLQVVSALLAMQSNAVPALQPHFQDSASRIEAMGRLHDQLHRNANVTALDLGAYLQRLAEDLKRIYGRADVATVFDLPATPVWIEFEAANSLVLLLQEILSNTFKHAFPAGRPGQVTIAVAAAGSGAVVIVADNGVGMPAATGERSSMGLNLIDMLAQQIEAKVEVSGPPGMSYRVTLPSSVLTVPGGAGA